MRCVRACDVPTPSVVDPVEARDFFLEHVLEAGHVAARAGDEDPSSFRGALLGCDDPLRASDAEAHGGFDHDVFAGLEGGDGVGLVVLVREEVEDEVDGGIVDDIVD